MNDFERLAYEELSDAEPPLGDLLGEVLRDGRHRRRVRRWAGGSGAVAGAAAVALAAALAGGNGPAPATADLPAPAVTPTWTVPSDPVRGPTATATTAALLEELLRLLPPGVTTGHYQAVALNGPALIVHTYVTTAHGTGQLELDVQHGAAPLHACTVAPGGSCTQWRLADGTVIQEMRFPNACDFTLGLAAYRPNTDSITLWDQTCLTADAHRERPGIEALTVPQMGAIITDPQLAWSMEASVVQAGARDFPHLPALGSGNDATEVVTETPPDRSEEADDAATRVTLVAALSELPPRDRAVLVLRYWEDQSVEATAAVLGISTTAVTTRSARALARLRERLGAEQLLL